MVCTDVSIFFGSMLESLWMAVKSDQRQSRVAWVVEMEIEEGQPAVGREVGT